MLWWLRGLIPHPEIRGHLLRDEGEDVVDIVPHHWVSFLRPVLYLVLGLLLVAAGFVVDIDIAWVFLIAGFAVTVFAGYLALAVHLDRFVVTNMRVFRIKGVFSQTLATMPLARILDITVRKPFIGRLLGYGHFVFESAAQEQGLREIHCVGRVDERDLTIQRVVQRAGLRGPRVG